MKGLLIALAGVAITFFALGAKLVETSQSLIAERQKATAAMENAALWRESARAAENELRTVCLIERTRALAGKPFTAADFASCGIVSPDQREGR